MRCVRLKQHAHKHTQRGNLPYYYIVYEFCCRCRSQFIVCCRCCCTCCCCCCSGVLWFLLLACFTSASRHVLLMFLLGLSLVQLLALCPLRLSWPSWPQQPQAQPQHKVIFSYYLQREGEWGIEGAGVAIVQGTFCLRFLWLATTQTKKRIGIINSLLHLLLSGANCVFVYIILCWPNGLKVLVPVLPAFKVLPLPSINYHCFLFCGPTAAL